MSKYIALIVFALMFISNNTLLSQVWLENCAPCESAEWSSTFTRDDYFFNIDDRGDCHMDIRYRIRYYENCPDGGPSGKYYHVAITYLNWDSNCYPNYTFREMLKEAVREILYMAYKNVDGFWDNETNDPPDLGYDCDSDPIRLFLPSCWDILEGFDRASHC